MGGEYSRHGWNQKASRDRPTIPNKEAKKMILNGTSRRRLHSRGTPLHVASQRWTEIRCLKRKSPCDAATENLVRKFCDGALRPEAHYCDKNFSILSTVSLCFTFGSCIILVWWCRHTQSLSRICGRSFRRLWHCGSMTNTWQCNLPGKQSLPTIHHRLLSLGLSIDL